MVDVGACVGDTTIPFLKKVQDNGFVIAVEPEPINTRFLRMNVKSFRNVEVVEKAAWSRTGSVKLMNSSNIPTGFSLVWGKDGNIEVPADTLDNICESHKNIDFVKIDAQGAGADVLKGAKKLMNRATKMVIETHYHDVLNAPEAWPNIKKILEDAGYDTMVGQRDIVYGILRK